MKLISLIKGNLTFYHSLSLLLIVGAYPLIAFKKKSFFLLINQHHHPLLDQVLPYISYLGSGYLYLGLMTFLGLMRIPNRQGLIGGLSYVLVVIIAKSMKLLFYPNYARPTEVFSSQMLHLLPNIQLKTASGFPSGHAATAFAMASFILLFRQSNALWPTVLLLTMASVVAFSRVYMSQHFYTDIYAGAVVGSLTTILFHWVLSQWDGYGKGFLDGSILDQLIEFCKIWVIGPSNECGS